MTIYMQKLSIDLSKITTVIKDAIDQNLYTPRAPFHLLARSYFEQDPSGESVPESVMTKEQAREFAERLRRSDELYGSKCKFKQYDIDPDIKEKIMSLLPDTLKDQTIELTLQICRDGDYLIPHTDHLRKSSFFIVLSEPDMITRFYKKIVDFNEYHFLKYANPDHLEQVFEENLEQDKWYLFNQLEFHSSHKTKDTVNRITFCIEFTNLTAEEVAALL